MDRDPISNIPSGVREKLHEPNELSDEAESFNRLEKLLVAIERRIPVFGANTNEPLVLESVGRPLSESRAEKTLLSHGALVFRDPQIGTQLHYPIYYGVEDAIRKGEDKARLVSTTPSNALFFPYQSLLPRVDQYDPRDVVVDLTSRDTRFISQEELQQVVGARLYVNVHHETHKSIGEGHLQKEGLLAHREAIVNEFDHIGFMTERGTHGEYRYLFHAPLSTITGYSEDGFGETDGLELSHRLPLSIVPEEYIKYHPRKDFFKADNTVSYLPRAFLVGKWFCDTHGFSGRGYPVGGFEDFSYFPSGEPVHFVLYSRKGELLGTLTESELPLGNDSQIRPDDMGHVWALDSKLDLMYTYFNNSSMGKSFDPMLGLKNYREAFGQNVHK